MVGRMIANPSVNQIARELRLQVLSAVLLLQRPLNQDGRLYKEPADNDYQRFDMSF